MSWRPELEELEQRRDLARRMGGPEGVARQHEQGKLTVREQISLLADPGSFREMSALVGSATYHGEELTGFTPKPAVHGMCALHGRRVIVTGGDSTVRGGAGGSHAGGLGTEPSPTERALEWRASRR